MRGHLLSSRVLAIQENLVGDVIKQGDENWISTQSDEMAQVIFTINNDKGPIHVTLTSICDITHGRFFSTVGRPR